MHDVADFRSDKVARPTPEMIEAMAFCDWGDGQSDEGETVRELERLAMNATGKPAALYAASGTLANQLAIHTHTRPGEDIVLDGLAHIFGAEGAALGALSGALTVTLPGTFGMMEPAVVERALSRRGAKPGLVCTENTHNFGGGRVMPLEYLLEVRTLARKYGANVHLDGARIFNASVKSGIPVATYAATADSIMFCLSKGLCAPAGSMLCGDIEFITRAREFREVTGALLKRPGPFAACGIIAMTQMVDRLRDDHRNTARLAKGLRELCGSEREIDIEKAETNMVFVTLKRRDGDRFVAGLKRERVLSYHLGEGRLRFALHRDIDADDVDRTVEAFGKLFAKRGA